MRRGIVVATLVVAGLLAGAPGASAQEPCSAHLSEHYDDPTVAGCSVVAGDAAVECEAFSGSEYYGMVSRDSVTCAGAAGDTAASAECGQVVFYDYPHGPTTGCVGDAAGAGADCRRSEGSYRWGGGYDETRCGVAGPVAAQCVRLDDEQGWEGERTVTDRCAAEVAGESREVVVDEPGAVALPPTPAVPGI
jgi:hypothetical protein